MPVYGSKSSMPPGQHSCARAYSGNALIELKDDKFSFKILSVIRICTNMHGKNFL